MVSTTLHSGAISRRLWRLSHKALKSPISHPEGTTAERNSSPRHFSIGTKLSSESLGTYSESSVFNEVDNR